MPSEHERIAVLEALAERNQRDIGALFAAIRKHMDQEEADRKELKKEIQEIKDLQTKQKSFVGGIVFAITSLWGLIVIAWQYLKGNV